MKESLDSYISHTTWVKIHLAIHRSLFLSFNRTVKLQLKTTLKWKNTQNAENLIMTTKTLLSFGSGL